ncbi:MULTISPECIES: hypothetical protein [unclassified Plantibacter]|uniref:hypothetical protein n=1 Tax=unclassified Plantibacter TaxID=2624265 RepID=UPI0009EA8DB7|nr:MULTISPECIES: hypothetical protein [unclassified Plantibacter]
MSHVATRGELRRPGAVRGALVRAVVLWLCIAALLVAAILSAWSAVARDVYGAGSFARSYLQALAADDAAAALALPGVALSSAELEEAGLPADSSDALLRSEALGTIENVRLVSDVTTAAGTHEVTFSYRLAGQPHRTAFSIMSGERTFGLFPSWRFETSPLSVVRLTVAHTTGFLANGFELDSRRVAAGSEGAFTSTVPLLTFTPGSVDFSVDTPYLTASVDTATTTEVASVVDAEVTANATPGFVSEVQTQVNEYLDGCAAQQVLQPTGCPFGMLIRDRVDDLPVWSIASYPVVDVQPGDIGWQMPATGGAAHIVVAVKSLFDGTVSTLDEDVPFTLSAFVTIRNDGSLYIDLR